MYKCRVLVQNKNTTKEGTFQLRNIYIKANDDQEAINNLNTVFSSFNFAIDSIKPVMLP